MSVLQVKKYKIIKDENGNKIQVPKTKKEWNRETKNGTAIYYFVERYKINSEIKQYKSGLFSLKRTAEDERRKFLNDPIEYIKDYSKKAKNNLTIKINPPVSLLLKDYIDDFISYESNYNKGATLHEYLNVFENHIRDTEIGNTPIENIDLKNTQKFYEDLNCEICKRTNKQYSVATKNKIHSVLNEYYQFLVNKGLLTLNYSKNIGYYKNLLINKNQKTKIKFQKLEDYELFMSVVDDDYWYCFFNFLFWHGCRIGEQRALKIKNIDFKNDTVCFEQTFTKNKNGKEVIGPIKNNKSRTIYLTSKSKEYVKKLIQLYKNMENYSDDWFLFGGPLNTPKNKIQRKLENYYNKLDLLYPERNIIHLTHHEFGRHSHASYLLYTGKGRTDIYEIIASRIGDTAEVVRQTYAHPYEDVNKDKSIELLK